MSNNTPAPEQETPATPDPVLTRPKRKRNIVIASIGAGVLLVAGGSAATIAVNNYKDETTRLCTEALMDNSVAFELELTPTRSDAQAALDTSTDEAIQEAVPGAAKFSTIEAVEADPEKKTEARASAAELIEPVQAGVKKAEGLVLETMCDSRAHAEGLKADAKQYSEDAAALAAATQELNDAVDGFKEAETARIAAEKAAAEKAAAEKQAAEERAAAEAAQAAAEQWVAPAETYYDPGYGGGYNDYNPGNGGGGSYTTPPAPQPAPAPVAPTMPVPPSNGGGQGNCNQPGVNCYL